MLTRLQVRNFKKLDYVDIELGELVVFVGPNNGGKTSALQALLLWSAGVREWVSQRKTGTPTKRPGVTMSRLGLTQVPVRDTKHLWRNLRVLDMKKENGKQHTDPIFLDVVVSGEAGPDSWSCGLEFYYANPESFYCRPLRSSDGGDRMIVPDAAKDVAVAMLPPLSGVLTEEPELQPGRISYLLGQGSSGEVLRNLCLRTLEAGEDRWETVRKAIRDVFKVDLMTPVRDTARGIIELGYRENGIELDITSAGRGLQQVLILLSYLESNHRTTLLLDEPDAHLEVLRQREVYSILSQAARRSNSQLVIASHSEVVMQEAIDRDILIGFVGQPRRMDDRGSQLAKALKEIRADDYYQAERKGYVLYLEGSTDLAILRQFAKLLDHQAQDILDEPFVCYVANQPNKASEHFFGLRAAKPDLKSFALFDRLERPLPDGFALQRHVWARREIENYIANPDILMRFASKADVDDLVSRAEIAQRQDAMRTAIANITAALEVLGRDPWSSDIKLSDEVLTPIFKAYYNHLKLSNRMRKTDFHVIADVLHRDDLDSEITEVLDKIVSCSK